MADIYDYLNSILKSIYGKDVRKSIHDAIYQCYKDGKAGSIDVTARERINNIIANGTPTEGNTELIDIRYGANGKTYGTAGEAVRGQITDINAILSTIFTDAVNAHVWEKFSYSQTIVTSEATTLLLAKKMYGDYYSWNINIPYGSNIGNLEGNIVVGSPKNTISITSAGNNISLSPFNNLKGKYAMVDGTCYKIPATCEFSLGETNTAGMHLRTVIASEVQKVESVKYEESYGHVASLDKTSYPEVGLSDDYRFEYKGTIGQSLSKISAM